MNSEFSLQSENSDRLNDELHIGKKGNHKTIKANVKAFKYQDKQTQQFVIYIPSLEISAYGETKEKAEEMIHSSLQNYCVYLANLTHKETQKELQSLGWKHQPLRNKDYSKIYVDVTGELKGFAVNEVVERQDVVSC